MKKSNRTDDWLNDRAETLNLVDRSQRPEYSEGTNAGQGRIAPADDTDKARNDAYEVQLVPVAAQVGALVDDEAEAEDAQEHLYRVDRLEGKLDIRLQWRLVHRIVRLRQSDAVQPDDQDDERFEVPILRDYDAGVGDFDATSHDVLAKVQAFVAVCVVMHFLKPGLINDSQNVRVPILYLLHVRCLPVAFDIIITPDNNCITMCIFHGGETIQKQSENKKMVDQ